MIILNGNTQKLQAVLAGAVNSDQPEFQATFGQLDGGVLDNYATNIGELNSTTDVDIVTGVANKQLGIKTVNIFNRDDAQVTITFKIDISATDRFIYRVVLDTGESVHYESNRGWYVCNANGTERSAAADDHTGQVTGASALILDVAAITAQTALAAGLAATDELILSDGGVLKRMDITVLEAYMEANISLPIGQVTGFTDNSADWDTAFGFGDHAGEGYLTAEATHTGHVTGDAALVLAVEAITGQTEITSGLASTDELVLNDGGVIKRMDISVIEAYMQANLSFTTEVNDLTAAVVWANVPEANVPTHTGDVTGGTDLSLVLAAITTQTEMTDPIVSTDEFIINDGGVLKRVDASIVKTFAGGGGGGGGTAWEQVTAADTIAAGEGFLVTNSGAAFDIDIAATVAADDEFIIHNASDSSGAVSIEPNTGHTIKGPFGSAVGGTDTILLAAGETIRLIAVSASVLEIV